MRTLPFALLAAIGLTQPVDAATRNFGITSFERIRVEGPYRVQVTNGVAPFAKASGSPTAIDRVAVEIQGKTLVVRTNPSWGGYPGKDHGPVDISLGTHELSHATLNGSGSLQIDRVGGLTFNLSMQGSGLASIGRVEVDDLRIALGGNGGVRLAGRAAKLTGFVRGMGTLDASGLTAKDADLGADGPATISAIVTSTARVAATGVATVTLSGNPACTSKVSGSASVSGCKPTR